jgi:hypothetical protein
MCSFAISLVLSIFVRWSTDLWCVVWDIYVGMFDIALRHEYTSIKESHREQGFDSRHGATEPPFRWIPGSVSYGIKQGESGDISGTQYSI